MADTIEVIAIDGCGRPKIITLAGHEIPATFGYAHEGFTSGPLRAVRFDHCLGEELDGRPVFRQVWTKDNGEVSEARPMIRYDYLRLTPIRQFSNCPKMSDEREQ